MAAKDTSRRVGLTPDRVGACALAMTAQKGLHGWSIRDLAAELDVVPSVIYHYFPTKAAVQDAVTDQILATVEMPDPDLPWQEWYMEILLTLRRVSLQYHGVTQNLVERSESGHFPADLLPLFETAIDKLTDAGFGAHVTTAHAMIINVAMGAISARDRQSRLARRRHDIEAMRQNLAELAEQSHAVALMRDELLTPLLSDEGQQISEHYFRLLITSLMEGMSRTMLGRGPHN